MKLKIAALVVALGLSGTQALAQAENQHAAGQHSAIRVQDSNGEIRPARCEDFVHNPDGSWSPNKPVMVGAGVRMGTGVSFSEGAVMSGINVAAILNAQCTRHKNQ